MFRVGETYVAGNGQSVLIIANDTNYHHGGKPCPVIGVATNKGQLNAKGIYGYDKKGWYCGVDPKTNMSYAPYCIRSDEPDEEELKMIADLRDIIRDGAEDDLALTKLLRQLRSK